MLQMNQGPANLPALFSAPSLKLEIGLTWMPKKAIWKGGSAETAVSADEGERSHPVRVGVREAGTMSTSHCITPLHLSGNTTEAQNELLQKSLKEAVEQAYATVTEQLDKQSAQIVLDVAKKMKAEVADKVVEIIHRNTVSDRYKDEAVPSTRVYPPTYRVRPVEAQVTELRKLFPGLGSCMEKLARRAVPEGADAWFAIPR